MSVCRFVGVLLPVPPCASITEKQPLKTTVYTARNKQTDKPSREGANTRIRIVYILRQDRHPCPWTWGCFSRWVMSLGNSTFFCASHRTQWSWPSRNRERNLTCQDPAG